MILLEKKWKLPDGDELAGTEADEKQIVDRHIVRQIAFDIINDSTW